jgi:hypothetical protein
MLLRSLAFFAALCLSTSAIAACPSGVSGVTWIQCLETDSGAYKDAGTTLAIDNDTVQQWNDASGSANNDTQATALNRPTFKTNIVNGLPVIRCNGSNSFMVGPNVFPTTQSYTLIVVSVQRGASAGNLVSGATSHGLLYNSGNNVIAFEGISQLTSTTATGIGTTAFHILGVANRSNTTVAHTEAFNLTVNGNYNTGIADTSVNASDTALQLCAFNGANFAQVDILAVYLAQGLFNLANTNATIGYVNGKYATTAKKFGTVNQLIVDYDSFGAGFEGQPPFAMLTANKENIFTVNLGSQGAYVSDLVSQAATVADPFYDSTLANNFYLVGSCSNDLVLGGHTGAACLADLHTYCLARKALGPNVKVGVIAMAPRSAGSEGARTTVNTGEVSDTCFDFKVMTTCNTPMWAASANTDPTWFATPTNIHWNANGHSIAAACLETAMEAWMTAAVTPYAGVAH